MRADRLGSYSIDGDLGGHPVLAALEVDDAVAALVPAADVAAGDAAVVVAPAALVDLAEQRLLRGGLRDLLEVRPRDEAPPGRRGLVLLDPHAPTPPRTARWCRRAAARRSPSSSPGLRPRENPRRLGLLLHGDGPDVGDRDVEQVLDRLADLGLVRARRSTRNVYWLCACTSWKLFSEMTGRTMTRRMSSRSEVTRRSSSASASAAGSSAGGLLRARAARLRRGLLLGLAGSSAAGSSALGLLGGGLLLGLGRGLVGRRLGARSRRAPRRRRPRPRPRGPRARSPRPRAASALLGGGLGRRLRLGGLRLGLRLRLGLARLGLRLRLDGLDLGGAAGQALPDGALDQDGRGRRPRPRSRARRRPGRRRPAMLRKERASSRSSVLDHDQQRAARRGRRRPGAGTRPRAWSTASPSRSGPSARRCRARPARAAPRGTPAARTLRLTLPP